jgi:hypothetical protein
MFLGLSVKCKFTSFNDHDVVFNWGDLSFDPYNHWKIQECKVLVV